MALGTYEKRPYSRAGAPGAVAAGAFNTPLPYAAPLDANSAELATDAFNSMKADTPGFDSGNASVYAASAGDATYTVTASGSGGTTTIKAPAGMVAGQPGDSPLEILDNVTNPTVYKEVRCWQVTAINDTAKTVSCTNLGVTTYDGASDGLMTQGNGAGNGLALLGGLVRGSDISDGAILHAIRVSGPSYIKNTFRAPAITSDQHGLGGRLGAGFLEMGTRFRLKSSVNPDTRTAWNPDRSSPAIQAKRQAAVRMMCRALQTYGFVISDGTGDADGYVFQLELDTIFGGTADWNSLIGQWTGLLQYYGWLFRNTATGGGPASTDGIPWDQLEVVANGTPTLPTVTTNIATAIGAYSATLIASINSQYDTGVVSFDYGLTTAYGLSASAGPVAGINTIQGLSKTISGLSPDTIYHYRPVFTGTRMGTYYGADQTFQTSSAGTVTSRITSGGRRRAANSSANTAGKGARLR